GVGEGGERAGERARVALHEEVVESGLPGRERATGHLLGHVDVPEVGGVVEEGDEVALELPVEEAVEELGGGGAEVRALGEAEERAVHIGRGVAEAEEAEDALEALGALSEEGLAHVRPG